MDRSIFSWDLFNRMPVVGIIRGLSVDEINFVLPIYKAAGFTTIEITLNTPEALSVIGSLANQYNGELNVGAGTVCTLDDLAAAITAGANLDRVSGLSCLHIHFLKRDADSVSLFIVKHSKRNADDSCSGDCIWRTLSASSVEKLSGK